MDIARSMRLRTVAKMSTWRTHSLIQYTLAACRTTAVLCVKKDCALTGISTSVATKFTNT